MSLTSAEIVSLFLGTAALAVSVWSNWTAYKAVKAAGKAKVAEFRKEWIESLRRDIAELLTQDINMLNCDKQLEDLKLAINNANDSQLASRLQSEALEVIKQSSKAKADRLSAFGSILLKLNDEESYNGELVKSVKQILIAQSVAESDQARNQLVDNARSLFKQEWSRLTTELKT